MNDLLDAAYTIMTYRVTVTTLSGRELLRSALLNWDDVQRRARKVLHHFSDILPFNEFRVRIHDRREGPCVVMTETDYSGNFL